MAKYALYYEPFHTIFSNLEDIINNSDEFAISYLKYFTSIRRRV